MQPNSTRTKNNTERIQTMINESYKQKEQSLVLRTLVFTQTFVIMIGGVCWSPGTGLHSALSTYVTQQ